MKYKIKKTSSFKTAIKKIKDKTILKEIENIIDKLENDEILEEKYNDHALIGEFKDCRECHIKPDLLLIYKINDEILELLAMRSSSHSELF